MYDRELCILVRPLAAVPRPDTPRTPVQSPIPRDLPQRCNHTVSGYPFGSVSLLALYATL